MKTSNLPEDDKKDAAGDGAEEENVRYLCMKYNHYQQGNRLACQDPGLYCKFRPSCLIHFKEKEDRLDGRLKDATND